MSERKESDLPLFQRVMCAVIMTILVVGVVWISAHLDQHG
jgi:heme/copper-type cytochrome/quinol oxidase subunit 4